MNENQKKLINIIGDFSEEQIEQLITFAEFLIYIKNKEIEEIGDEIIRKNRDALRELSKY